MQTNIFSQSNYAWSNQGCEQIKGANRSRVRTDQGRTLFISSVAVCVDLLCFAGREDTSEVKDEDPSESTDVWKCAPAIKLIELFTQI